MATLFFTLENKLYELQRFGAVPSDLELYQKLIELVKPYISGHSGLAKVYLLCQNHLNMQYHGLNNAF